MGASQCSPRLARRNFTDQKAQHVRFFGEIGGTGAVADGAKRHFRNFRVARRKRGGDRRTGGRDQLFCDAAGVHGRAAQQFGGRGRRHGQQAVRRFYLPGTHIERRAGKFVDAQQLESDGRADDVHDRIHRADFVEMHLLDGNLVNSGFRFGEPRENLAGAFGGARRELRFLDTVENFGKSAVVMPLARCDFHVCGENLAALHLLGGNCPAFEAQFAQLGFDGAQIDAGVHQGAENHVAADAGEAIEIGDAEFSCFGATYRG